MAKFGETPSPEEEKPELTPEDEDYLKEISDKEQTEIKELKERGIIKEELEVVEEATEKADKGKEPKIELTEKEEEDFENLKREKTFQNLGLWDDFRHKKHEIFSELLPAEITGKNGEEMTEEDWKNFNKAEKEARKKAAEEIVKKLEEEGKQDDYLKEFDKVSQEINKIGMEKISEKLKQPKEAETKLTPDQEEKVEKVESAIEKETGEISAQVEQLPEEKKKLAKRLIEGLKDPRVQLAIAVGLTGAGLAFPGVMTVVPALKWLGLSTASHIWAAETAQAAWAGLGSGIILTRIEKILGRRKDKKQEGEIIDLKKELGKVNEDITKLKKEMEKGGIEKAEKPTVETDKKNHLL